MTELFESWQSLFVPREILPLSKWAEANLTLSSEYSAKTGPIALHGWQREPLDSFTDPRVETTVLMCSTQMLKTILIQAALAYVIAEQPGPAMVLEPKEADAKAFSKERLGPMIRDCEPLRGRVLDVRGKSTITEKSFPGGTLALVGAIAPGNLARRSIRYLFADETDKYPLSAGTEGDPIALARERTVTFGSRRKIVLCCSPTVAGRSRIGKAYEASDQRRPWVPCPNCGKLQILTWGQVRFDGPAYECLHCKARWTDVQRQEAAGKCEWRAEAPFRGTAGFWISHLYSPWKRLEEMVSDFQAAQNDKRRLQVFINTSLAELWREAGETPDEDVLMGRREEYEPGTVPQDGLFLTAAVDVQDNPPRLEVEVAAWGRGRETWSIDYRVIQAWADPEKKHPLPVTAPEVWEELDRQVLQRDYQHASGQTMPVMVMAIDTGSRPKPVYEFAKKHAQPAYTATGLYVVAPRTVAPVKGTDDDLRVISSVSKEDAARKRQGVRIIGIGTHCVKQELYDVLRHGRAGAGRCHFPQAYERPYFQGLCSEERVVLESGEVVWRKRANVRNEPLDLKVYNRGAAAIFGIDRFSEAQWKQLEDAVKAPAEEVAAEKGPAEEKKRDDPNRERWIPKRNWFR